jgi:microcystin-dependent protein
MPSHDHGGVTGSAGLNISNTASVTAPTVVNVDVADNAGTHSHSIAPQGGNVAHNNMQPTLFIGNVFIFSGVPTAGYYPGTVGMNPPLI